MDAAEVERLLHRSEERMLKRIRSGEARQQHASTHRASGDDIVGIIVEETDGSPSVKSVTKIKVSNTTLTDNGDGSVSLSVSTAGAGAPTDADYLVGTANGNLSAEIVVGVTPGGELGGTWASPTVDATHSGSAHHSALTIGADAEHSLAGQVLSGVDATATQKGHALLAQFMVERATQAIAAGTTISVTDNAPLTPFTTTGNVTNTAAPFIAAGRNGQLVILRNDNGSGTLTISDTNIGAGGSLLRLSANTVVMAAGSSMALEYSTIVGAWVQLWYLALVTITPSINSFSTGLAAIIEVANTGDETAPTYTASYTGVPAATPSVAVTHTGTPAGDPANTNMTGAGYVGPTTGNAWHKGTSVGAVKTATLSATVNGSALTRTATATYYNSRYAGVNTQATALSSAQTVALGVLALDNGYNSSSKASIAATTTNYIWYCYRSALGITNLFFGVNWKGDGTERAAFSRIGTGTVSVTNASGFAETFEQYKSDIVGINSLTGAAGTSTLSLASTAYNNRIQIGPDATTDPIATAAIRALDDTASGKSVIASSVAGSYVVTIGAAKYLWFCHPASISDLATIKDSSTGFAIAGSYRTNVSHTNDLGYTETYRCWRSDNVGIFPSGGTVVVT